MGASTRAAGRRDELFPVAERLERAALGVDARVLQLLERVRLHLAGTARPLRALDAHLIERLIQARLGGVDLLAQPLARSEEHTSELQSRPHLVCRLLLEK